MPADTHVEQGPIGRDEIFEIIRDRLADILEIEPSNITEGQSFVDDLEADSLALIELVEGLEEEVGERTVGFRIEDEDLEDLKTVRDAVDYVLRANPYRLTRRTVDGIEPWTCNRTQRTRSATRFNRIGNCSTRRWRTGRGARRTETRPSNERLEFLGDAVLGCHRRRHSRIAAFKDVSGGDRLTDHPQERSSTPTALAEVAIAIDLGRFVKLGKGESRAPAAHRQAVDPVGCVRGGSSAPCISTAARSPGDTTSSTRLIVAR